MTIATRMPRTHLPILLVLAIVLLAAACGGNDDDPSAAEQSPASETAREESQTQSQSEPAAETAAESEAEADAGDQSQADAPKAAQSPYAGGDSDDESATDANDDTVRGKTGPQATPVVDPDDAGGDRDPAAPLAPTETNETERILAPADIQAHDEWGWSGETDGVRLISGAPFHDEQGAQSGVAFIYRRESDGSWTEEAKLLPDDGEAGAWFGRWTAIDGDVAVVGAPLADFLGDDDDAGAAYVFERAPDGAWTQTQRLLADIPLGGHQFGWNVDVEGDTIIVSSSNDSDGGGQRLHVFQRAAAGWVLEAELEPSVGDLDHFFAQDIALSGDTIVAGAKGWDSQAGPNAGAVFVFERTAQGWQETALLEPDDAFVLDLFGRAVDIAGDTIVVGAYLEDEAGADGGSVYVFERDPSHESGWRQAAKLTTAAGDESDWFGFEVATDGRTIVAGAPHSDRADPELIHAGFVAVFTRTDDGWREVAQLRASDAASAGDSADYGWAVAVQDDVIMVGAWLADTEAGVDAGRAYVYSLID